MDDQLLDMLGRALHSLGKDSFLLDDLIFPRSPSSGENAGKAPSRGKSKPPVSVPILDVKVETENVLTWWVGAVRAAWPDQTHAPDDKTISVLADWLHGNIALIEQAPWGQMCADEIIAQARLVDDVVMPPAHRNDPMALEMGTAREIASWARNLGYPVSRSSVQNWANAGKIASEIVADGRVLVRLDEVLEQCRTMRWKDMKQEESS